MYLGSASSTVQLAEPEYIRATCSKSSSFFKHFFQNALFEWNLLDCEIRNCSSISQFKKKLISIIRRVKNSTYRVYDIPGIRLPTRLSPQFSDLKEHRFKHAFDCLTPVCICGLANEDNKHFLLHCPQYHSFRLHLFGQSRTSQKSISSVLMIHPFAIFFCMEVPVLM